VNTTLNYLYTVYYCTVQTTNSKATNNKLHQLNKIHSYGTHYEVVGIVQVSVQTQKSYSSFVVFESDHARLTRRMLYLPSDVFSAVCRIVCSVVVVVVVVVIIAIHFTVLDDTVYDTVHDDNRLRY